MAGKRNTARVEPKLGGLRLHTSLYGLTIPAVYGRNRLPGNLLWYGDFTAHQQTERSETGKGGRQPSRVFYTYTASVVMGLADGWIGGVRTVWRGKEKMTGVPAGTVSETKYASTYLGGDLVAGISDATYTVPDAASWSGNLSVRVDAGDNGYADLVLGEHYTVAAGVYTFKTSIHGWLAYQSVGISWTATTATPAQSALTQAGLSLRTGLAGQSVWSHLTANHPSQALGYSGIAYLYAQNYNLNDAAEVENHNFEVDGLAQISASIPDASPATVLREILLNTQTGIGFPGAMAPYDSGYNNYVLAANLLISPVFNEQRPARDWIEEILEATNADACWNGRTLRFLPRGDDVIAGALATYTPNTTPVFDLGPDDFESVEIERIPVHEMHNVVKVEFCNRANDYDQEPVEASDEDAILLRGRRAEAPQAWYFFCTAEAARSAAQLRVQRKRAVRARYRFALPFRFVELEPGDLVTITDPVHELVRVPARVTSIEEGDDDRFEVEAEDFPIGHANAPLISPQIGSGFRHDYNTAPGNAAAPAFLEDPESLASDGIRVMVAVTGEAGNTMWGGCEVYASVDGGSSYRRMGRVEQGARYGVVGAAGVAAGATSVPVVLAGLGGQMPSPGSVAADALLSLCFIGPSASGEFVAYEGATLTGTNAYTLTGVRRAKLGTADSSHAAGEPFVYLDSAILKSEPLPVEMIGKAVHFKFCSFNVYGGGLQSLDSVPAYAYTVTGRTYAPAPPASLSGANEKFGVRLTVGASPSRDVAAYEYRVGASWATAEVIGRVDATTLLWRPQLAGSVTFWAAAVDSWGNVSTPISAALTVTGGLVDGLALTVDGDSALLVWNPTVAAYEVSDYEIRLGATYAGSALLGYSRTTTFRSRIAGIGVLRYWVAARDVAGNTGTPSSVDLNVLAPAQPVVSSQVVDNFVLLRWQDCKTTLPVERYEVYKNGVLVGDNGDGRFAVLFEETAADYTYGVKAYDSAGNASTLGIVTARVSAPPDYVLRDEFDSTFTGPSVVITNAYLIEGVLHAPMQVETDAEHTTRIGVTTDSAAAGLGYDKWWEPGLTSASYREVFDLGVTVDPSTISVVPTVVSVQGVVTIGYTVETSATGAFAGEQQTYSGLSVYAGSSFRYVRVTMAFTADGGGDDLVQVTALKVKVATKLRTESGVVNVTANPTTVVTSGDIDEILAITLTPSGTAGRVAVYNYAGGTTFDVYLFNSSGAAATGPVSWTVRGV